MASFTDIETALERLCNSETARRIVQHGPINVDGAATKPIGLTRWMDVMLGFDGLDRADKPPQPKRARITSSAPSLPPLGGAAGGTQAHRDMERICRADRHTIGAVLKSVSPYARQIYKSLCEMGLTLIKTEVRIYDPDLDIVTAIDAVCCNRRGDTVFVEYKNTNDGREFQTRGAPVSTRVFGEIMFGRDRASLAIMQVTLAKIIAYVHYGVHADTVIIVISPEKNYLLDKKVKEWSGEKLLRYHQQLRQLRAARDPSGAAGGG